MGKIAKFLLFFICVNAWAFSDINSAIHIPLSSTYVTLDPNKLQDISSLWVSRQINCQLVRKYERGAILEAASSIKYVSPIVLSIQLRKDIFFSDGAPVTAQDVVETFNYLRHNGTEFRNIFDWIKSIEAKGSSKIIIVLRKHVPNLMTALSAPHYPIFKKSFIQEASKNPLLWKKPIGCGGYRVYKNQHKKIILLPNGKGLPIVFTLEINTHVSLENAKNYDLIAMYKVGHIKKIDNFHLVQIFDPYQFYFAFNTRLPIWKSKKNRCAVFSKINPDIVIKQYDDKNKPADNIVPSGVLGYESNKEFLSKINTDYATVSIPKKQNFCISSVAISIEKEYQPYYLKMLQNIYPDAKLKIINGCSNLNKLIERQKCDGTLFTYKSNYLDAYEFMQALSSKNSISPTGYYDPQLAAEIKNSQMLTTIEEKAKVYRKIIKQIEGLCLLYPLFTVPYDMVLVKDNLLTPGLGEEPINEYYLGHMSFQH